MSRDEHPTEDDFYYSVEDAARLTGRSKDMVWRYIRTGQIDTVQDPTDERRRLIPIAELGTILDQPRRGLRRHTVTLTLSDGRTIQRVIARQGSTPRTPGS